MTFVCTYDIGLLPTRQLRSSHQPPNRSLWWSTSFLSTLLVIDRGSQFHPPLNQAESVSPIERLSLNQMHLSSSSSSSHCTGPRPKLYNRHLTTLLFHRRVLKWEQRWSYFMCLAGIHWLLYDWYCLTFLFARRHSESCFCWICNSSYLKQIPETPLI